MANRDLKLENLLVDQDVGGKKPLLKICDFGYSKHEMNSSAKSGVGTPIFMAPEIVFSGKTYDAKVGISAFQHISGHLHIQAKNNGNFGAKGCQHFRSLYGHLEGYAICDVPVTVLTGLLSMQKADLWSVGVILYAQVPYSL